MQSPFIIARIQCAKGDAKKWYSRMMPLLRVGHLFWHDSLTWRQFCGLRSITQLHSHALVLPYFFNCVHNIMTSILMMEMAIEPSGITIDAQHQRNCSWSLEADAPMSTHAVGSSYVQNVKIVVLSTRLESSKGRKVDYLICSRDIHLQHPIRPSPSFPFLTRFDNLLTRENKLFVL